MKTHLVIARVRGIEIGFHSSWLILAALLVSSLAGHFSIVAPQWGARLIWTTACVTALCVFASLILHELAHAAVARSRGIPVRAITLFALGGVAQIQQDAGDPRTEFWMGLAGPLASAGLALLAFAGAEVLGPYPSPDPILSLLGLLGAINLALAAFNLIPGFPLDGGRVLRAAIWGWTGDFTRSTKLAARAGQATAGLLLALGAGQVITGAGIGGLWLAILGWFLLEAATASFVQADLRRILQGLSVRELMAEAPTVDAGMRLREFVDGLFSADGGSNFVVVEGGLPAGLISPEEVARVPKPFWPDLRVRDAMRRLSPEERLEPGTSASDALETMARHGLRCLPVLESGALRGLLTRVRILRAIETRRLI